MPCNTISTQTLSAGLHKAVPEVLEQAARAMGAYAVALVNGVLTFNYNGAAVSWSSVLGLAIRGRASVLEQTKKDILQAYSKQAVTWAAKRAGWQVRAGAAQNELVIVKG